MGRNWYRTAKAPCICTLVACTVAVGADEEKLKEYARTVGSGPSLYLTKSAMAVRLPKEVVGPDFAGVPDQKEALKVLDAALALGAAGREARKAVAVLARKYPKAVHVELLRNQLYQASVGTFEDWVLTKTMGVKTKLELTPPFLSYGAIEPCTDFIKVSQEHEIIEPIRRGGRLESATVDITVMFEFHAAACALTRITGMNYGTDRSQWLAYAGTGAARPASPAPRSYTVKSSPPPPPTRPTPASGSRGGTSEIIDYSELLRRAPVGSRIEVTLYAGSILVGKLVSIDSRGLRIDVQGAAVVPVESTAVKQVSTRTY
jgi:hypothetical protein